jgi:hypothetical protein
MAIRKPTCVFAAIGVSRVRIAATKRPQPKTHLAPNRSANVPIYNIKTNK